MALLLYKGHSLECCYLDCLLRLRILGRPSKKSEGNVLDSYRLLIIAATFDVPEISLHNLPTRNEFLIQLFLFLSLHIG